VAKVRDAIDRNPFYPFRSDLFDVFYWRRWPQQIQLPSINSTAVKAATGFEPRVALYLLPYPASV
jgi:hypothetical protein